MPEELTDAFILGQIEKAGSHFFLDDLIGKTISGHRKIKNPEKCDPQVEPPDPEYFDVFIFSDNTFLLTECIEDKRWHLRYYFYNGRETFYSLGLLDKIPSSRLPSHP